MNAVQPWQISKKKRKSRLNTFLKKWIWLDSWQSHQKRGVIFSQHILGVTSPLFAYSWIDNSYYLLSRVHGHLGFEFLNHETHSAIFNDIVCSDLTSHTCIIPNILLDHYKNVSVTGIGAIKYINVYIHKATPN